MQHIIITEKDSVKKDNNKLLFKLVELSEFLIWFFVLVFIFVIYLSFPNIRVRIWHLFSNPSADGLLVGCQKVIEPNLSLLLYKHLQKLFIELVFEWWGKSKVNNLTTKFYFDFFLNKLKFDWILNNIMTN